MTLSDIVKKIQLALNQAGAALAVDGDYGPKTRTALVDNYDILIDAEPRHKAALPPGLPKFKFTAPEVRIVGGVKYETKPYATMSGNFAGLVVHYTVSGRSAESAKGVVRYLASKGLGCMVMDENGIIYVPEGFDLLTSSAAHAGLSKWGGYGGLNSYFAGMEICGLGKDARVGPFRTSGPDANIMPGTYQAFTSAQENALTNFIAWALSVNSNFSIGNVCGHDEARAEAGLKGNKSDPGASLSMTMPAYRKYLSERL